MCFIKTIKYFQRYHAYKHHWSDIRLPVILEVTSYSLDQLDPATNKVLASYHFKDFEGICTVSDYPGKFNLYCKHLLPHIKLIHVLYLK